MVSAWLTFTCYLLIFFTFDHEDMNQVDRIAIHDVRRVANYFLSFLRRNSTSISLPVIKQIALVLSDQQLITVTSVFVQPMQIHAASLSIISSLRTTWAVPDFSPISQR